MEVLNAAGVVLLSIAVLLNARCSLRETRGLYGLEKEIDLVRFEMQLMNRLYGRGK